MTERAAATLPIPPHLQWQYRYQKPDQSWSEWFDIDHPRDGKRRAEGYEYRQKSSAPQSGTVDHLRDELALQLSNAWSKYVALFGEYPRGTPKQMRALLELIPTPALQEAVPTGGQIHPLELLEAGNKFRDSLVERADAEGQGHAPLWYGWAIMDAFIAGAKFGRHGS